MYQPVKQVPMGGNLRGPLAWAMYFLLVLESMSMAICLVYGIQYSHMARQSAQMRSKLFVALLVYLWIGFAGYLVTIPCICAALYKQSGKFLIPYLIWRLIFTLGTIGLGVALGVFNQEINANLPEIRKETMEVFVPPVVIQSVLGVLFTCIAFVSFAQLNRTSTGNSRKKQSQPPMNSGVVVPYQEPLPGRSEIGMVHPSITAPSYFLPEVNPYGTYRESRGVDRRGTAGRRRAKSLQAALNNYSPAYGYHNGWNPAYYGLYSNWKY